MNLVVWLVVGGLMGGLASVLTRGDGRQAIASNVLVGVTAALAGGWFFTSLVSSSASHQGNFSGAALLASLLGAALLLAISNVVRREIAR